MKKLITVTGCFLMMCIMITGVILPSLPKATAKEPAEQPSPSSEPVPQTDKNTTSVYIIKAYNGKLAVFKNDEALPVKITDVIVSKLPLADQENINKGIIVNDETQLKKLLRDYSS